MTTKTSAAQQIIGQLQCACRGNILRGRTKIGQIGCRAERLSEKVGAVSQGEMHRTGYFVGNIRMTGTTGFGQIIRVGRGGDIARMGGLLAVGLIVPFMAGDAGLPVVAVGVHRMAVNALPERNGCLLVRRVCRTARKEKEKHYEVKSVGHIPRMAYHFSLTCTSFVTLLLSWGELLIAQKIMYKLYFIIVEFSMITCYIAVLK